MATPTTKAPAMTQMLERLMGRTSAIENDLCLPPPFGCGGPADRFDDALSETEYSISGLCQVCQNTVFVDTADED